MGTAATLTLVPFPDDPEEEAGFIPPLPPDDRLWRHPSEMSGQPSRPGDLGPSMASPPSATPPASVGNPSRQLLLASVIGLLGVASLLAIIAATGVLGGRDRTDTASARGAGGPGADELPATTLAALSPALVRVTVDRPSGETIAGGLIIASDGHLVTSADAIISARSITVTTADGTAHNATVVGSDATDDIAVLDIDGEGMVTAQLGAVEALRPSTTLFVISSAAASTSITASWIESGTLDATEDRFETSDGMTMHGMIRTSIGSRPPAAASILCTADGTIVGIVTGRTPVASMRATSTTYAAIPFTDRDVVSAWSTPAAFVERVADDIIADGRTNRPTLGVVAVDVGELGAAVVQVAAGGSAAIAGMAPGDLITSIDARAVRNASDLVVALRSHEVGDVVRIGLLRGGTMEQMSVMLSERP